MRLSIKNNIHILLSEKKMIKTIKGFLDFYHRKFEELLMSLGVTPENAHEYSATIYQDDNKTEIYHHETKIAELILFFEKDLIQFEFKKQTQKEKEIPSAEDIRKLYQDLVENRRKYVQDNFQQKIINHISEVLSKDMLKQLQKQEKSHFRSFHKSKYLTLSTSLRVESVFQQFLEITRREVEDLVYTSDFTKELKKFVRQVWVDLGYETTCVADFQKGYPHSLEVRLEIKTPLKEIGE